MSPATKYDARFWERYFRYYDALNSSGLYQDLLDRVAELAALHCGERVLDIGAGTGNLLGRLRATGAEVAALDANVAGLLVARRKEPKVPSVLATLESPLPFGAGSFEVITAVNVLYALSPAALHTCLCEVRRLLRPTGRIVFSVPVRGMSTARIYAESVRQWVERDGLLGGLWTVARLLVPTIAILSHNLRIRREAGRGSYQFFGREDLMGVVDRAGLVMGSIERRYAGQAWVVVAHAGLQSRMES